MHKPPLSENPSIRNLITTTTIAAPKDATPAIASMDAPLVIAAITFQMGLATGAARAAISAPILNTVRGVQMASSCYRPSAPNAPTAVNSAPTPRPAPTASAATTKILSRNAALAPTSVPNAQGLITAPRALYFIRSIQPRPIA